MTWFEKLTGFDELPTDQVRENLRVDGERLISLANDRTLVAGEFTTPALEHLRASIEIPASGQQIRVAEKVADIQSLHQDPKNENAVFQVASQFNCLEMASPHAIPEAGVGIYQNDWTQGPACCICAGAGTIFRNYFVELNGQLGQSADHQVDCLAGIDRYFDNATNRYWQMQNGYCLPTAAGLAAIEEKLASLSQDEREQLGGKLMVGYQAGTEVTIGDSNHFVSQVFCSALPVAYSDVPSSNWDHFPRLILDATYELTFYLALQNQIKNDCDKLYLTLVGGGVFGNKLDWILSSIDRSLRLFASSGLDVKIVSYGASKKAIVKLAQQHTAD